MRLFSLTLLLALAAAHPAQATAQPQFPDSSLAARDSAWNVFRLRGDARALAPLLADTWLLTHSDGRTQDKRDYLDELARGARGGRINTAITNADVRVQVYGNAAVITGASVQSGVGADGQPFSGRFRFTRVWVRQPGSWVMVASHSSREAAP